MIKITIERESIQTWKAIENRIKHRIPTDKVKPASSGAYSTPEPLYEEEYEPMEITKSQTNEITLLKQQIEDETKFDLGAVIKAINSLP